MSDITPNNLPDALAGVAALQPLYTSFSTPEMQYRGKLIRRVIPNLITQAIEARQVILPTALAPLKISASDGISAKAEIPWVRLYLASLSPRATVGRYLVYLFENQGKTVWLSLSTGAMQLEKGRYIPRPSEQLAQTVHWAKEHLRDQGVELNGYPHRLELGRVRSQLGRTYIKSSILAMRYSADALPGEAKLETDLTQFLQFLEILYAAEVEARGRISRPRG
ncbi:MAG: DUF3578 domain-containing protein [Cyanobacteria bacterium P01_F01_bin.4]